MNNSYPLTSNTKDCANCYKCIRSCPVKSISFADNKAQIIHEDCILCGTCFLVCPKHLKIVRNDIDKVKKLIENNEKVIVSLAPSFVAEYKDSSLKALTKALKTLGFYDVEETAIGATIVKKAYDDMLDEKHDVIISSCCHAINLLIQKHYPDALPYLAHVLSPMLAHGKDIKARYGKDTKVVFIGPCIAKKDEADRNDEYIDAVLTYQEINEWLNEENITLEKDTMVDNVIHSKARLFPTCGGILKTMACSNKDYQYIAIDGIEASKKTIEDLLKGKIHKCFIEMSSCQGSCINGPMVDTSKFGVVSSLLEINKFAGKEDFDKQVLGDKDIAKNYNQINVVHARPGENEIEDMLIKMGKADEKKRLNCGSCGYNTCKEKAIAIIQGKAVIDMCLPSLLEKAQSFSDKIVSNTPNGLMVLDEDLNIQLANKAMLNLIRMPNSKFIIGNNISSIMNPEDFAKALAGVKTVNKKVYLPEYEIYLEETIIYDNVYHIIIAIFRDITKHVIDSQKREEVLKKSVEIADKVVKKNMMTVQEIASLLGESAAETKVALSSLKDTLKDDDK